MSQLKDLFYDTGLNLQIIKALDNQYQIAIVLLKLHF